MNVEIIKALCILLMYENELRAAVKASKTTIDDQVVDGLMGGAKMFVGPELVAAIAKQFPAPVTP